MNIRADLYHCAEMGILIFRDELPEYCMVYINGNLYDHKNKIILKNINIDPSRTYVYVIKNPNCTIVPLHITKKRYEVFSDFVRFDPIDEMYHFRWSREFVEHCVHQHLDGIIQNDLMKILIDLYFTRNESFDEDCSASRDAEQSKVFLKRIKEHIINFTKDKVYQLMWKNEQEMLE